MASLPAGLRLAVHSWRRPSGQHIISRPYPRHTPTLPIGNAGLIRLRMYSDTSIEPLEPPEYLSDGERKVFDTIKEGLQPTKLEVQDISGGCGSMYALDIVSDQFKGLSIIKQHRLVNKVLGEEMKQWHGVQLKTKAP